MKPLDVDLLLARGSIAGPYTRTRPVTKSFRRSLRRFWWTLWGFITSTKGPL